MTRIAMPVTENKSIVSPKMPNDREHPVSDDERSLPILGARRIALLCERDKVLLHVESQMPGLTAAILRFLNLQRDLPDDVRADVQKNFKLLVESGEPSPELETLLKIHGERLARFSELARPATDNVTVRESHDRIMAGIFGELAWIRSRDRQWFDTALRDAGRAGSLLRVLMIDDEPENYAHLHIVSQADAPRGTNKQSFWP